MTLTSQDPAFWDNRYSNEGAVWGYEASITQQMLLEGMPLNAVVFEVGFGYGRDVLNAAQRGYEIHGIEMSPEGVTQAQNKINENGLQAKANLLCGKLSELQLPKNFYGGLFSHRVLHLFQKEEEIRDFVDKVADMVKEGAPICICARDTRNQDPADKVSDNNNVHELNFREGHQVNYWDNFAFKKYFGEKFAITEFAQIQEQESLGNDKITYLTVMKAYKRTIDA